MTSSTESTRGSSRYLALALVLFVPFVLLGCPGGENKPADATSTNSSPSPGKTTSDFDGDRAFEHVRKQVEFGPRPPGSPELEKTRGYLIDQLKSYGLKVTTDEFHPVTPVGDRKMVNVTAELPGESSDVIIISSHYDTKLISLAKKRSALAGTIVTIPILPIRKSLCRITPMAAGAMSRS